MIIIITITIKSHHIIQSKNSNYTLCIDKCFDLCVLKFKKDEDIK